MSILNIKDYSEKGKIKRTLTLLNERKISSIETVKSANVDKVEKITDVYKMNRKQQEALLKKHKVKFSKYDNESELVKKILKLRR